MTKKISQTDELVGLIYDKSARIIFDLLNQIAVAKWEENAEKENALLEELSSLIASTRGYADMLGRRRVLLRLRKKTKFTIPDEPNPIIPRIPFQEAIDDLVSRLPALAQSAEEVRQIYSVEHSFALARSASLSLTKHVQKAIADAMQEGKPVSKASDLIARIGDWNYAYASTVYRTNLNTSYHAGQFRIMKDPEVREIVPAFKYVATLDADVRPNHRAMHNIIANMDDDIWQRLSPPLGYNCRCSLITVDVFQLRRMGLDPYRMPKARIPAGAYPDYPEFGVRPDIDTYGY
jgi:SPP1 gp7 family putative phage head morphogenesis protein